MTDRTEPSTVDAYLTEIAERLFSNHATVMVGSGLSRNARAHSDACDDFPDWQELGDVLYAKVHRERRPDSRYLNVPTLADEVEAVFGRRTLEKTLRDAIPDDHHEPSSLHVRLLNLPWSDVFTTNYDTLLERACDSVTSRKYDVVVRKGQLIDAESPRIIKLHGSFSSNDPLVITDEDYRRYPKDHAPFVNTVRQALLESTLCLIGFSGSDPNFLQWIGWMRDNFGDDNSAKIYLGGWCSLQKRS